MDNSQEEDVDADMEDKGEEVKMEYAEQPYSPFQEKHEEEEEEDNNITFQTKEEREIGDRSVEMESDNDIQNDPQEETSMHHEDEKTAAQLHRPKVIDFITSETFSRNKYMTFKFVYIIIFSETANL